MTLEISCAGCQLGNHGLHLEWIKGVIPGVIGGGVRCPCTGDCQPTVDPVIEFLLDQIGPILSERHIERGYN